MPYLEGEEVEEVGEVVEEEVEEAEEVVVTEEEDQAEEVSCHGGCGHGGEYGAWWPCA